MRSILFIVLIWAFSATPALSQSPAVDCPTNWLPWSTPIGVHSKLLPAFVISIRYAEQSARRGEHEFDVKKCQCEHGEQPAGEFSSRLLAVHQSRRNRLVHNRLIDGGARGGAGPLVEAGLPAKHHR